MVDELQMAVREMTSPATPNSVEIEETAVPIPLQCNSAFVGEVYCPQDAFFDSGQTGRLADEIIAAVKDDRMNTKRAMSANIASTARVQAQNDRVIEAYERELHRRDLTDDQRMDILNRIAKVAELTADANEASRKFQQELLEHSHKLPVRLLVGTVVCILLRFGGKALFSKVA